MKIKDFLKTEEYKLIRSIITSQTRLDNLEFIRSYFTTSEFYKDNNLVEEIISLLDDCANGTYYRRPDREFPTWDCNTLLLLMKMSSPHDFHDFIEWGLCSARHFWTNEYYISILRR